MNDAISDLPKIHAGEGAEESQYDISPINQYQKLMRKESKILYNHVAMKHRQRIIDRFKETLVGQGIKDVADKHPPKIRLGRKNHNIFSQNHNRLDGNKLSPTIAAGYKINWIHPTLHRSLTA